MNSCVKCAPTFLAQIFRKKSFYFFNSFFYLYLETKPSIVFQGIIFHMDIIIASRVNAFNA